MSVEACLVLQLFLFAFLNIISIIDVYRLQGNMSAAMHDSAKKMAVYGYEYMVISGDLADDHNKVWSLGLTYTVAATNVSNRLGDDYPEKVSWLQSKILEQDECIDLMAEYSVQPPISLMGYGNRKLYNRLRTRAWTGYDNAKAALDDNEEIVYITETGTVYHVSRGCTYLRLSISMIHSDEIEGERNVEGGKYSGCEECGGGASDIVYITNYGKRYHSSLRCSKLKRTVSAVPKSKVGDKGACSKCTK